MCYKIWLLALPRGALTTFPYKLCPKFFFSAVRGAVHPVHPLSTPIHCRSISSISISYLYFVETGPKHRCRRHHRSWSQIGPHIGLLLRKLQYSGVLLACIYHRPIHRTGFRMVFLLNSGVAVAHGHCAF